MKERGTGAWVASHLCERGLIDDVATVAVSPLAGGVSGDVFEAQVRGRPVVVKRALPELTVADPWLADPGRIVIEAAALQLALCLTPSAVPEVIDIDPGQATLVLERAPAGWVDWRSTLLAGETGEAVAARLGEALAVWHRETTSSPHLTEAFQSQKFFEELRLAPFYEFTAGAHPNLEQPIGRAVERLRDERTCLVHGDFSPKNVLHGDPGVWVLDWEVAHVGAPIFDIAFLGAHLNLKSIHRPADAEVYRGVWAEFLHNYEAGGGLVDRRDPELGLHIGCLLLARVDGKSPAGYLTPAQRVQVRDLATGLVRGEPEKQPPIWEV